MTNKMKGRFVGIFLVCLVLCSLYYVFYANKNLQIAFADKLEIVVQRIYQQYKGYSSIDEVRDMNIDGVSGRSIRTS